MQTKLALGKSVPAIARRASARTASSTPNGPSVALPVLLQGPLVRTLVRTVVGLGLASVLGCSGMKPESPDPEAAKSNAAASSTPSADLANAAPSALSEEARAKVVASFGESQITLGDIEAKINEQPLYVRVRYNSPERRKELVEEMVRFELMANEAIANGLDQHPDVVFAAKQAMIAELLAQDESSKISAADIKDEDIVAYYESHIDEFAKPDRKRASLLVVDTMDDATRIAAAITSRIEAAPSRSRAVFSEHVDKFSVDRKTRLRNGDLGQFDETGAVVGREEVVPKQVVGVVFALKSVNDVSAPFALGDKFGLVQLLAAHPGEKTLLKDIKGQLRTRIHRERQRDARQAFIDRLETAAKVQIDAEVLATLPEIQPEAPDMNGSMKKMTHEEMKKVQERNRNRLKGALEESKRQGQPGGQPKAPSVPKHRGH